MLQLISRTFVFAFLLAPIALALRLLLKRERSIGRWFRCAIISSIVCYICVLLSVQLTEMHLESELNRFDLNGDGGFSGEELTPEMKAAMKRVTNDTGRTLAPITGAVFSPIYCSFWFVLFGIATALAVKLQRKTKGEQATAAKRSGPSRLLLVAVAPVQEPRRPSAIADS